MKHGDSDQKINRYGKLGVIPSTIWRCPRSAGAVGRSGFFPWGFNHGFSHQGSLKNDPKPKKYTILWSQFKGITTNMSWIIGVALLKRLVVFSMSPRKSWGNEYVFQILSFSSSSVFQSHHVIPWYSWYSKITHLENGSSHWSTRRAQRFEYMFSIV